MPPPPYIPVKGKLKNIGMKGDFAAGALAGTAATKVQRFRDKYYTENLSFPLNVDGDSQEGHYIIFSILEQDRAKLMTWKNVEAPDQAALATSYGWRGPAKTDAQANADNEEFVNKNLIAGSKTFKALTERSKAGLNNSIQLAKAATTLLKATIALYMPSSVTVSYKTKYGEAEIGLLAETGAAAIKNFMETEGSILDKGWSAAGEIGEGGAQAVKQKSIAALNSVATGAAALIAISRGKIITPRMELMFEGIGRREFSYSFTMIPKSEQEADSIEGIVTRFKHAMAADYSTGNIAGVDIIGLGAGADGVREMDIPSFFDITYMYKGKENNHLNKISTCVLRGMDVTYGADRFKTYRGGVPQTTQISLSFAELNIITKKHIEVGY
mgnify:CR=1 FL=1